MFKLHLNLVLTRGMTGRGGKTVRGIFRLETSCGRRISAGTP